MHTCDKKAFNSVLKTAWPSRPPRTSLDDDAPVAADQREEDVGKEASERADRKDDDDDDDDDADEPGQEA